MSAGPTFYALKSRPHLKSSHIARDAAYRAGTPRIAKKDIALLTGYALGEARKVQRGKACLQGDCRVVVGPRLLTSVRGNKQGLGEAVEEAYCQASRLVMISRAALQIARFAGLSRHPTATALFSNLSPDHVWLKPSAFPRLGRLLPFPALRWRVGRWSSEVWKWIRLRLAQCPCARHLMAPLSTRSR